MAKFFDIQYIGRYLYIYNALDAIPKCISKSKISFQTLIVCVQSKLNYFEYSIIHVL